MFMLPLSNRLILIAGSGIWFIAIIEVFPYRQKLLCVDKRQEMAHDYFIQRIQISVTDETAVCKHIATSSFHFLSA